MKTPVDISRDIAADLAMDSAHIPSIMVIVQKHLSPWGRDARNAALDEAFGVVNSQSDLSDDQIPDATIEDPVYFLGIRRGYVNSANIISRLKTPSERSRK